MKSTIARPVARNAEATPHDKKSTKKAMAMPSRKSEPVIAAVERKETVRESPEMMKKIGAMPVPFASFTF